MSTVNTTNLKNVASDVNNIVLSTSGDTTVVSMNNGQLAGLRNRIINGNCQVAQRPSVDVTGTDQYYGGPDRFYATKNNDTAGSFTQSQEHLVSGGRIDTVRQTVVNAVTDLSGTKDWHGINQRIEGYNCYDLTFSPFSVSFIFKTNVSGTFSMCVRNGAHTQSYVSTFDAVALIPKRHTFSLPANPLLAIPNDDSTGLEITVGFLNQGDYIADVPAAFGLGRFLNTWEEGSYLTASTCTNWGVQAGNYIELTNLQVEKGTESTPFEEIPYSLSLANCQRYYQKLSSLLCFRPGPDATTVAGQAVRAVQMRANGTTTTTGGTNVDTPVVTGSTAEYWLATGTASSTSLQASVENLATNAEMAS